MAEITDKELTKLRSVTRDGLRSDIYINILSIEKILILEKLKKNKENYLERFLVILPAPARLLIIKSGLVGKSIQENILIITINEIKYYAHNKDYFCIQLVYNERSKSLILCTQSIDACNQILINLLSVCHMVSQCLSFSPTLTDISGPNVVDKIDKIEYQLDPPTILALSYQILCILDDVAIDKNLYDLFKDDNFHDTNHIFDVNYILRHYTQLAMKQGTKKYKINPNEVVVVVHALQCVDSFTHIHLDGINLTGDIAKRLAKLVVRNDNIQSIALRKTGMTPQIFYIFNQQLDEEIIKKGKKMVILDHLTLSHNDLQHVRKKQIDSTFFEGMDGNVLCVRKLYLSRCNLNRDLLCSVVDSSINYSYLNKIDLSHNDLSDDGLITYKLSQFCRRVECLESMLLADCKLKLTFLQDIVRTDKKYKFAENLMFLDLSGNIMTHYGAQAIGQILQNTVTGIKIDLSAVQNMDSAALETILFGPFRSSFKNIEISLMLCDLHLSEKQYLSALDAQIQYAQKQKSDTNGIQHLDLSRNLLCAAPFSPFCNSYIAKFYSLESLSLDMNFTKNKKGFYAIDIQNLCAVLSVLDRLDSLSLCGDGGNNLYLTYEDLAPLLQYLGTAKCRLMHLFLNGNRIKDDGCKAIAKSISANPQSKLKIISIEDNKCSFKGFKVILDAIDEAAAKGTIHLCDIPIHSILDDSNFKNKVKKHKDKIEKVIAILNQNRLNDEQEQAQKEQEAAMKKTKSPKQNRPRASVAPPLINLESEKKEQGQDPSMHYAKRLQKSLGGRPNVDKLASLLNVSNAQRLSVSAANKQKPIKGPKKQMGDEKEEKNQWSKTNKIQSIHLNATKPKETETKIVSMGIDAQLNKPISTTKGNVKNAKSKRKKKTRKKLVV